MEPFGALQIEVVEANSLKDMVGPCGLEPQTSTVSMIWRRLHQLAWWGYVTKYVTISRVYSAGVYGKACPAA
jgi:hypothetical protein